MDDKRREVFVDNMLREYLIEYTKWLNARFGGSNLDIIENVHKWMASDKANTDEFVQMIIEDYHDKERL